MKSGGFHAKDLYMTFISVLDLMNEKIQHSVVFHAKDLYITFISVLDLMAMKSSGFHS